MINIIKWIFSGLSFGYPLEEESEVQGKINKHSEDVGRESAGDVHDTGADNDTRN